jgi:hypothetical protein
MEIEKRDLDRSGFHQIHSYIQHYQPNVIAGGLFYPLSKEINEKENKFLMRLKMR